MYFPVCLVPRTYGPGGQGLCACGPLGNPSLGQDRGHKDTGVGRWVSIPSRAPSPDRPQLPPGSPPAGPRCAPTIPPRNCGCPAARAASTARSPGRRAGVTETAPPRLRPAAVRTPRSGAGLAWRSEWSVGVAVKRHGDHRTPSERGPCPRRQSPPPRPRSPHLYIN
jgi:hypothetical protein